MQALITLYAIAKSTKSLPILHRNMTIIVYDLERIP